jgi:hypothetical protein
MMSDEPTAETAPPPADERSRAMTKFDDDTLKGIVPSVGGAQRAVFLPANFGEALEMAKLLASGIGVRPWCRGNVSACMMIVQQAVRWGMDAYAVANKAYYVNDQVAFESQLVNAVVNTSREIVGRLDVEWAGEDENLVCTVSGALRADPDKIRSLDQPIKTITVRNSPVWKVNPKLQLAYHATRSWARLYVPEVLLGVYTPDELVDGETLVIEARTGAAAGAAPDRRDFVENGDEGAEDAQFEPVSAENGQNAEGNRDLGSEPNEKAPAGADSAPGEPEIPEKPAEWEAWEGETTAAIADAKNEDALKLLSKRIGPALAVAPDDLGGRVHSALTDRFVDFAGS